MGWVNFRWEFSEFAWEFLLKGKANSPLLKAMERMENEHPVEVVGKKLHTMMPWLNPD